MAYDSPGYHSTACPADTLGFCTRLPNPEAVIDHLLADHDPRVIATVLVRERYVNGRIADILEGLGVAIEKEIDALVPDPLSGDTVLEIQFGEEG